MNTTFKDIHEMLAKQLRNLSDDDLCKDSEKLKMQADRAKAMCGITSSMVALATTQLHALEVKEEYGLMFDDLPEQLDAGN